MLPCWVWTVKYQQKTLKKNKNQAWPNGATDVNKT